MTVSILTILKNPMILMGLVSMVMFIGMPKLMENSKSQSHLSLLLWVVWYADLQLVDPEMKAEFEARQAQGPLASLMGGGAGASSGSQDQNFDMAAYLAGSKKDGGSNGGSAKNKGGKRK
jgi:ER membrane protein complex subunit 7